ncbi:MAG: hypothetical protein LQ352_004832 [Teloschistes flavicans]|nr:MAG: hypothetical protein LQ352_004832 [Teloschistes flavicans]
MTVRRGTNLEAAEANPFAHNYLLRRPQTHELQPAAARILSPLEAAEEKNRVRDLAIERRRFELFIDLIWVGIIGNIAENFSEVAFGQDGDGRGEESIGQAAWHFIILFLMAWRFWSYLQEFMSKYATNDMVERAFVVWALILAMLFGNNAPYLFDPHGPRNYAIYIYLIWRGSVLLIELYYSFFIHHIRRRMMVQGIFICPVLPLWLVAMYCKGDVRAGLAFAAINLEFYAQVLMDTPLASRLLDKQDPGNRQDSDHWTERVRDFYIIILGEGVLSLIRGSPLGKGISPRTSSGVVALLAYYVLNGFYFNGDQSRRYIHAVRRTYWRKNLWQFFHHVLFASTLILSITFVFLVQHPRDNSVWRHEEALAEREAETEGEDAALRLAIAIYAARWTVSFNLALILLCQTLATLMHRSLDPPRTLKVNNRYLRVLPRILLIPIVICLAIDRTMNSLTFLGIISGLLLACLPWEWWASLEHDGGVFER